MLHTHQREATVPPPGAVGEARPQPQPPGSAPLSTRYRAAKRSGGVPSSPSPATVTATAPAPRSCNSHEPQPQHCHHQEQQQQEEEDEGKLAPGAMAKAEERERGGRPRGLTINTFPRSGGGGGRTSGHSAALITSSLSQPENDYDNDNDNDNDDDESIVFLTPVGLHGRGPLAMTGRYSGYDSEGSSVSRVSF